MAKVVTLGEIMLRLSPPGYQRFAQASDFEINYGGAEANVAASLAQFGNDAAFVSKIPANAIGDAAVATMKKLGVDCRHIVRGGKRLGIYFLENGASVRPSSVVYDRADSAITQALAEEFDFDTIFEGVDLFHVSGITPVLSNTAAELTITALKKAKEHDVTVSFDLNYRAKLWTEDVEGKQKMLSDMMPYVDICFGNARDAAKCLGYTEGDIERIATDDKYITLYYTLKDKFGDHGLVAVVILEKREEATLFIDTWLMSCRVLKRGMEEFIVNAIFDTAKKYGFKKISAEYIPTAKNKMVSKIYDVMGFDNIGDNQYELDVVEYKNKKNYITMED